MIVFSLRRQLQKIVQFTFLAVTKIIQVRNSIAKLTCTYSIQKIKRLKRKKTAVLDFELEGLNKIALQRFIDFQTGCCIAMGLLIICKLLIYRSQSKAGEGSIGDYIELYNEKDVGSRFDTENRYPRKSLMVREEPMSQSKAKPNFGRPKSLEAPGKRFIYTCL